MKYLAVVAALLSATPCFARDLAVPAKNPAITLTVPDSWKTTEDGTSYKSLSQDKDVFFYVEFADAADVADLQKNNVSWMKSNNLNWKVKPVESEMDVNGSTAKVQRFNTSSDDGKTVVEFITLPASKDRVVMLTLWASEAQRAANAADIAAILKSVKLPGSAAVKTSAAPERKAEPVVATAPASAPAAEPAPVAAPATGPATLAELESADQKVDEVWARLPYGTRNVMFVSRKAENIGDYEKRPNNVFAKGEPLLTYIEPIGFSRKAVGDHFEVNTVLDLEVLSADKKTVLNGQKAFMTNSIKSRGKVRDFFLSASLNLDGAPAGSYVVAYTLHDSNDRTTRVEQPFTIKE
jgi:hypothetical protein